MLATISAQMKTEKKVFFSWKTMDLKIFVEAAAFAVHLESLESADVSKRTKLKFISSIYSNCV